MSNILYMFACREKAKDPAWLVGHIEDLVRYRPSLEGYSVEEVLESMLIQTCLASIKVGRHPYPTSCYYLLLLVCRRRTWRVSAA